MTIAQSEESCVVYGMPKAAIERGYAMRVVALDVMANDIAGTVPPAAQTWTAGQAYAPAHCTMLVAVTK